MWTASPVTQSKVPFRATSYPAMGSVMERTTLLYRRGWKILELLNQGMRICYTLFITIA
jgi:hypothetical protein